MSVLYTSACQTLVLLSSQQNAYEGATVGTLAEVGKVIESLYAKVSHLTFSLPFLWFLNICSDLLLVCLPLDCLHRINHIKRNHSWRCSFVPIFVQLRRQYINWHKNWHERIPSQIVHSYTCIYARQRPFLTDMKILTVRYGYPYVQLQCPALWRTLHPSDSDCEWQLENHLQAHVYRSNLIDSGHGSRTFRFSKVRPSTQSAPPPLRTVASRCTHNLPQA